VQEEKAGTAGCEEGGDVGCGGWVGVDVFEIPIQCISFVVRYFRVQVNIERLEK